MSVRLVDFENPPVVETLLSVQFEPLRALRSFHIGELRKKYLDTFPDIEELQALEPVFEKLTASPMKKRISFELTNRPEVPRYWLVSKEGNELIQIQQDRFIKNWRSLEARTFEEYPHYEDRKEEFSNDLKKFKEFIVENEIGEITPNQCEITYINHIEIPKISNIHGNLAKVLTVFDETYSDDSFLKSCFSDAQIHLSYSIKHKEKTVGKLHILAEPKYLKEDNREIYILTLIARGEPLTPDLNGVNDFFDLGREYITKGFKSITTTEMHKLWECRQ